MITDQPPPRYGTRTNPRTGMTETYELPAPVDLAKARRELSDVLHGGGWFEDPLATQPEPIPEPEVYLGTSDAWASAIESIRQGR